MEKSKEEKEKGTTEDYEDVVCYLGGFGRYQRKVFLLMCLPVMSIGIQTLMSVFSMITPHHRCAIPELKNDTYMTSSNSAHEALLNRSIPWVDDDGELVRSSCLLYRNWNLSGELTTDNRIRPTTSCEKWVFDHSTFTNTFTEEASLVCDEKDVHAYADMLFMVGKLVGSFIIGIFCDFFGRKTGMLLSMALHSGSALATYFVPNLEAYVAMRFIMGGANFGVFLSAYVLALELVERDSRTRMGQLLQMSWSFGLFLLAALAYALRDWRDLQLAVSCPTVIFLGYYWLMEESPRWLISKGRYEEANAILRKVARVNGQPPPPTLVPPDACDVIKPESPLRMFTHPVTLIRTIIIFFNWVVCIMIYYGLSLNVGSIAGNVYLNFTLSAVSELLGYLIAMVGLDRLGRKVMHCGSMIVGGLALLASMFPVMYGDDSVQWTVLVLSNVGKLGASSAISIVYLFSAELFPTVARNSLIGLSSTISRLGGIVSPYIGQLNVIVGGQLGVALPLVVFGGSALAAGLLALLLPETLHKPLPDTIEDARSFGRKRASSGRGLSAGHTNPAFIHNAKSD